MPGPAGANACVDVLGIVCLALALGAVRLLAGPARAQDHGAADGEAAGELPEDGQVAGGSPHGQPCQLPGQGDAIENQHSIRVEPTNGVCASV